MRKGLNAVILIGIVFIIEALRRDWGHSKPAETSRPPLMAGAGDCPTDGSSASERQSHRPNRYRM